MSAKKDAASTSVAGQSGKDVSGEVHAEKSVDKLNEREFCDRFCIPYGVSIQLVDGEAVSTEKSADNAIYFTKEQFNAGLRFPLPSLFKEFLHFTQIPPAYIHPNIVRVLMGCSILNMLFNLDLSLLEVLFIYSIKKEKTDLFSLVAHLPSLQLVTHLPDSTKGGAKGHVLVRGVWAGLLEHPERPFSPNRSLVLPGTDRTGCIIEWVKKASFDRLNKLFEIAAGERHHQTLLTVRNLLAVVWEPQAYVINILPRDLPKRIVSGKHFFIKDLLFTMKRRKAEAKARQTLLNEREERRQEGTLQRALDDKCPTRLLPADAPAGKKKNVPTKGIVIRSPAPSSLPFVSSDSERIPGQNGSGPSIPAAEQLALLAAEGTSVDQSDSPPPDVGVVGASYPEALPPTTPPAEETGTERQGLLLCESSSFALVPVKGLAAGRSRPARDLRSGISRRLQDRLLETIEVSCSSVQEDHPEESKTEMADENPTDPVLVPNEGSPEETQPTVNDGGPDPREESHHNALSGRSLVDDATCTFTSPFSYAELREMLKQIPPASDVALPSARMFEGAEMLVSGIRGMVQQHDLFSDLLRTADYMKAFISQRMRGEEGLCSRLEQAEASLSAARRAFEESAEALKKSQDDNEVLLIELAEAKRREEATEACLHEAEDEAAQLRGEVRQLQTEVSIEKKQKEDLQLRLSAQKEELETEFAAQKEELETEYQKQVDEMYFFGYRCCMKKHGIKRDVPSIPPGEEEKLRRKPSQ